MNIGIFTDTYYPQVSGVATSIKTLKEQLESQGHHVYIFTTTDPKVASDEYEKNIFDAYGFCCCKFIGSFM